MKDGIDMICLKKSVEAVKAMAEILQNAHAGYSLAAADLLVVVDALEFYAKITKGIAVAKNEDLNDYSIEYQNGWLDCLEKIEKMGKV